MPTLQDSLPDETHELFARARAGDQAAWNELFEKCYPKLRRAVRRRLDSSLRSVFDSTDFASDVMKSLAANADRLDFPSFEALAAFLENVARKKLTDEYRKAHAKKRDVSRQCALTFGDGEDGRGVVVASPDPTASQVALATEAEERLVSGQREPDNRVAIELKKEGHTHRDISERLGWDLRKVQRFFKGLQDQYQRAGV